MKDAFAEAQRALYGTWRLCLGDASGLLFVGHDKGAFWRSYAAIGASLVPEFLSSAINAPEEAAISAGFRGAVILIVLSLLGPLIIFGVARLAQRIERAIPCMIAVNWSTVLLYVVLLPADVLAATEGEPGVGLVLTGVVVLAALFAMWRIYRLALNVPHYVVAALLTAEILLAIFLASLAELFI